MKNPKDPPLYQAAKSSLLALNRIGSSKFEARQRYNADVREQARAAGKPETEIEKFPYYASPYIHSFSTMTQYLYLARRYCCWLEENHPEVKRIQFAHKMGFDREYIQTLIDAKLAPSTIARANSAVAKLHRCRAKDVHDARPKRAYAGFTRSRKYNQERYAEDLDKYGDITALCRATGVRRVELQHTYPECFRERPDGTLYLHLDGKKQHTKGGKTRDVTILAENQEMVREILSRLEPGKLICPHAPGELDIHAIRAIYAMDFYFSIARPITPELAAERVPLKRPKIDRRNGHIYVDAPGTYRRRSDGMILDRRAMLIVSKSLGHERVDVIAHSYIR